MQHLLRSPIRYLAIFVKISRLDPSAQRLNWIRVFTGENTKPGSLVDGASFGRTIAYGEVNPEALAINHNVVNDLDCIERLAQEASGMNGTSLTLAFIVVGARSARG
ncbi:hypothetical protein BC940DRAFT_164811 [Gongronella butleri]|nr:hypothetical protein BC940DRAFT_164811 [Gongronella butleri]